MPDHIRQSRLGLALAACLLLVPLPASAQVYADWSQSIRLPGDIPGVSGTICRLVEHSAYVAGDELVVVDVTRADAPVVLGRTALPAAARDLLLRWPVAYAACGPAGLVELDVSNPTAIRVTRVYLPDQAVTQVAFVNGLIVAVDAASRLHLVAAASTGQLAAVAVHEGLGTIRRCVGVNGYLALAFDGDVKIFDVRNPLVLSQTDSFRLYDVDGSHARFMDADGSMLVLIYHVEIYMDYNYAYYSHTMAFTVDDSGRLGDHRTRSDRRAKAVAISGDTVVFTRDDNVTRFLDAADLQPVASIRLPAESLALGGGRLMATSGGSVTVLDLGPGENIRPVRVVYGDLIEEAYNSVAYTLHIVEWAPPFALRYLYRYYNSGYHSGYESVNIDYRVCDAASPLSLRVFASGLAGGYRDADYSTPYGLGFVSIPGSVGDRVLVDSARNDQRTLRIIQRITGAEICRFSAGGNSYEGPDKYFYARSGSVWIWSSTERTLARHLVSALNPSVPRGVFAMDSIGRLFGPDSGLIINAFAGHVDIYDASVTSALVLLAHDDTIRGANAAVYAWFGRTLVYAPTQAQQELHIVDFADPSRPVLRGTLPLPARPVRIATEGNRFAVIYEAGGFQTGEIDTENAVALRSPPIGGVGTSRIVRFLMAGNVAYADDGACILAYDLRDFAAPAFIGRAFRGNGNLALVGDYLASGNILLPRDIRDVAPPRRITIEVRPVIKPSSGGHGSGLGFVPVAVLGDADFDVTTLDPTTVRFGPAAARDADGPDAPHRYEADLDGDGDLDLMFHFRLAETGLGPADATATLTGSTYAGQDVVGTAGLRGTPPDAPPAGTRLVLSPNPFNPRTTVGYTLAAPGPARVAVYDLRGRRVALLAEGRHEAGPHEAVWQGLDDRGQAVPSGTYFVRVEADGQVLTRKALLLK